MGIETVLFFSEPLGLQVDFLNFPEQVGIQYDFPVYVVESFDIFVLVGLSRLYVLYLYILDHQ